MVQEMVHFCKNVGLCSNTCPGVSNRRRLFELENQLCKCISHQVGIHPWQGTARPKWEVAYHLPLSIQDQWSFWKTSLTSMYELLSIIMSPVWTIPSEDVCSACDTWNATQVSASSFLHCSSGGLFPAWRTSSSVSPSQILTLSIITVCMSDSLHVHFVLVKRLWISWFPPLCCLRCRKLEFMITYPFHQGTYPWISFPIATRTVPSSCSQR